MLNETPTGNIEALTIVMIVALSLCALMVVLGLIVGAARRQKSKNSTLMSSSEGGAIPPDQASADNQTETKNNNTQPPLLPRAFGIVAFLALIAAVGLAGARYVVSAGHAEDDDGVSETTWIHEQEDADSSKNAQK